MWELFLVKLYLSMMKNKQFTKTFILLVVILIMASCTSKAKKNDDAQRIVSMAPSITEVLFSLGIQDRIVGVSDFCTFPKEAMAKESIGGLFNPNLEKIAALQPDLILATKSYQNLVEKLGKDRFKIVLLPEKTTMDLYATIDSIGVQIGRAHV